jgi:hypothetical protein
MKTSHIYNLVKRDMTLRDKFIGVFAADTYRGVNDGFYIVNTDSSDLGGTHWVVYYVKRGITEFFDSCGKNGDYYGMKDGIFYNNVVLQGSLPVCGYYCLYYCLLRCRGISIQSIVYNLKRCCSDIYVSNFVLKHFLTYNIKKVNGRLLI